MGRMGGWIRRVGRRNPQTRPFWPSKRVLPGNGMPDALAPLKQSCPEMGGGRWPATPTSPGTDQLEPSPLRARGYARGLGITPKSESTKVPIKLGLDLISLRRLCLAQVVHRQDGPLIQPLPCRPIGASRGFPGWGGPRLPMDGHSTCIGSIGVRGHRRPSSAICCSPLASRT